MSSTDRQVLDTSEACRDLVQLGDAVNENSMLSQCQEIVNIDLDIIIGTNDSFLRQKLALESLEIIFLADEQTITYYVPDQVL